MMTYISIALTCWLCALVAVPQKPLPGNEAQELVYARLLGRHQRLVILALVVSSVMFFASVVSIARQRDADLVAQRAANAPCSEETAGMGSCGAIQPQMNAVREKQDDGRSVIVSTYVPNGTKAP
jgi:hypothetical protein